MSSKVKEILNDSVAKVAAFIVLAVARANYLVYSSDAFVEAASATNNLKLRLINLADAIFPLAIVICGVCMFFTRDQKKFDAEKHILIGCCLAFALITLVTKANVVTTIKNLFP